MINYNVTHTENLYIVCVCSVRTEFSSGKKNAISGAECSTQAQSIFKYYN